MENYDDYDIYDIIYELGLGDYIYGHEYKCSQTEILDILHQTQKRTVSYNLIDACKRELAKIRRMGIDEYNAQCKEKKNKSVPEEEYVPERGFKLVRDVIAGMPVGLKRAILITLAVTVIGGGVTIYENFQERKAALRKAATTTTTASAETPIELDPRYGRITYIVQYGDFNKEIVAERLGLNNGDLILAPGEKFYPKQGEKVDFYVPKDFANNYNYYNKEDEERYLIAIYNLQPGDTVDDMYYIAKEKYPKLFGGLSKDAFFDKIMEDNPLLFGQHYSEYRPGEYKLYSYVTQDEKDNKYPQIAIIQDGDIVDYRDRVNKSKSVG